MMPMPEASGNPLPEAKSDRYREKAEAMRGLAANALAEIRPRLLRIARCYDALAEASTRR
jgi:hypothetical protein